MSLLSLVTRGRGVLSRLPRDQKVFVFQHFKIKKLKKVVALFVFASVVASPFARSLPTPSDLMALAAKRAAPAEGQ